jgi:flagellar assembly factor FliW
MEGSMQLETSRFGTIDIDPEKVITFTQPIIGFQEYRRFVLMPASDDGSVHWLQSTESGDLAFLLMNPRLVLPDYAVRLAEPELAELAVTGVDELEIFTLLVVPDNQNQVRTNLKAPILINLKHRLGRQQVMDRSDYPIQYFLAQAQQGASQEVSNARSDA